MIIARRMAYEPSKLYAEIIAALPALAARAVPPSPFPVAQFTIEGDGQTLTLNLPDGTDAAAIGAVLTAHNPAPLPPILSPRMQARAALANAATVPAIRAALLAYIDAEGQ